MNAARPPQVPGLSHLASEFYEVTTADPDNISLDRSVLVLVLEFVMAVVVVVVVVSLDVGGLR